MSFLYPRTISISRPSSPSGKGAVGYGGHLDSTNTLIQSGIAASIQLKKEVGTIEAKLPGDVTRRTYWNIIFKGAQGLAQDRDIITDDAGIRYQVTAAYWNSLGFQCLCERMEA